MKPMDCIIKVIGGCIMRTLKGISFFTVGWKVKTINYIQKLASNVIFQSGGIGLDRVRVGVIYL